MGVAGCASPKDSALKACAAWAGVGLNVPPSTPEDRSARLSEALKLAKDAAEDDKQYVSLRDGMVAAQRFAKAHHYRTLPGYPNEIATVDQLCAEAGAPP
jgi:hypothetical protein